MDNNDDDKAIFLRHLPGKVAKISASWSVVQKDIKTSVELSKIMTEVDELFTDTSAIGFIVLYRNLDALKKCLEALISDRNQEYVNEARQISHLLGVIKKEIFFLRREHFQTGATGAVSELKSGKNRSLYFFDVQKPNDQLTTNIGRFGYNSAWFSNSADFIVGFLAKIPDAIVMGAQAADAIIKSDSYIFEKIKKAEIPLIFTSDEDNFNDRHNAAKVDAIGFMVEPYQEEDIAKKLDHYFNQPSKESYRVLLVEDTQFHIEYISSVLTNAGMQVEAVSDPLKVLDTLEQSNPEIILMDLYMPNCNGIELAKIIRQYPRYLSIPIAYLSVEESIDKQLDALSIGGGDDFINKSISKQQLVHSVKNRIVRYRSLCRLITCDSLTGLLNHTKIKESLALEVARADRLGANFAYAMIDIDYFKKINDNYGHAAGDQVINTLAQMLKGRLRSTDLVGRYGGEEFAVILLNTDMNDSLHVLDSIRNDFSQITHKHNNHKFKVTFSGGVASFPYTDNVRALSEKADMALYQAKNNGRNRICLGDL